MVAIGVFVVMALAVGGLLLHTSELSEVDEEMRIASMDLSTVMETINGLPFDDVVTTYPDEAMVSAYYNLNLPDETLIVDYVDPAATNPLEIRLSVTWRGYRGLMRTQTLTGLRVR